MDRGTDAAGLSGYLATKASLLGDAASSRYRLVASTVFGREGVRVLRLSRTSIAAGSMATWERRAAELVQRLAAREGLLALAAGVRTDEYESTPGAGGTYAVLLTAWTEWDALLGATGSRLDASLLDAGLADLEGSGTVDHFELITTEPSAG